MDIFQLSGICWKFPWRQCCSLPRGPALGTPFGTISKVAVWFQIMSQQRQQSLSRCLKWGPALSGAELFCSSRGGISPRSFLANKSVCLWAQLLFSVLRCSSFTELLWAKEDGWGGAWSGKGIKLALSVGVEKDGRYHQECRRCNWSMVVTMQLLYK